VLAPTSRAPHDFSFVGICLQCEELSKHCILNALICVTVTHIIVPVLILMADAGCQCIKVLMSLLPTPGRNRISAVEAFDKLYYVSPVSFIC